MKFRIHARNAAGRKYAAFEVYAGSVDDARKVAERHAAKNHLDFVVERIELVNSDSMDPAEPPLPEDELPEDEQWEEVLTVLPDEESFVRKRRYVPPQQTQTTMKASKYPSLETLSYITVLMGWLSLFVAVWLAIYTGSKEQWVIAVCATVGGVLSLLAAYAFYEMVKLAIDIEEHLRTIRVNSVKQNEQ